MASEEEGDPSEGRKAAEHRPGTIPQAEAFRLVL
jgi:hypothetical protein